MFCRFGDSVTSCYLAYRPLSMSCGPCCQYSAGFFLSCPETDMYLRASTRISAMGKPGVILMTRRPDEYQLKAVEAANLRLSERNIANEDQVAVQTFYEESDRSANRKAERIDQLVLDPDIDCRI